MRTGWGGRISTQHGRERAEQNFRKQQCDWGCWTWPTAAHQASGRCPRQHLYWFTACEVLAPCDCRDMGLSAHNPWHRCHLLFVSHAPLPLALRCFLPFPLLNLCCFKETRERHAWSLPAVLFSHILCTLDCLPLFKPTKRSSAQPYPPVSCTCRSFAQNQRHTQLHNPRYWCISRWFTNNPGTILFKVGFCEKPTLHSCKLHTAWSPKQKHPRWQYWQGRKGQLELVFSPRFHETRICQSFHSNNSFQNRLYKTEGY